MEFNRVYAVVLRHLYIFRHGYDKYLDIIFWPLVDLLLWGIMSLYVESFDPGNNKFIIAIISGIIFWHIVWKTHIEMPVDILEDIWNKNLINLFATPLKFSEWITAFVVLILLKLFVSVVLIAILAFLLYEVNILSFGIYLVPFIASLLFSGLWLGTLISSVILRFGSRAQALAWSLGWMISPISAVYYPVSILPLWLQKIAWLLPTSHIFEGMRSVIKSGTMNLNEFWISFVLNIIYFIISIYFLKKSFRKVLENGLIKVY